MLVAALLGACSSIPNVQYSYFPAKANIAFTVTQSVTCNADNTEVNTINTASPNPVYSSDFSKTPFTLNIKDLEGSFSRLVDSDLAIAFYDDGRLKSINQSTTGQAEAFVKSAVSVATSLAAIGGGAPEAAPPPPAPAAAKAIAAACKIIADASQTKQPAPPGGDAAQDKATADASQIKAVTLTYKANFSSENIVSSVPLSPAAESASLYNKLKDQLPRLVLNIHDLNVSGSPAKYLASTSDAGGDFVKLTLQNTKVYQFDVVDTGPDGHGRPISSITSVIPVAGTYFLPIPRAALFGKQSLSVSLSEAGAITAIDYGKTSGAAGALNAVGSITAAAQPESAAAKAADLKAQADVIAQQQRLIRCRNNPTSCT